MQLSDNGFAFLYPPNVSHAWPHVQGRGKITQFLRRTGGIDFHAAIVQITGPTAEP